MSKTTKIIAALGVVAGLGVAALPAFTYAAETVTGDVDVLVEVEPAIAMTISGNNDSDEIIPGDYNATDAFNPAGIASTTEPANTLDGHTIPATSVTGTSSSAWKILPNAVKEGGTFASTITVYTNASAGYTLTLKDADTDNSLKQSGEGTVPTIPAVGTQDPSNAIAAGSSAWGFRVYSQHGTPLVTPAAWAAVPVSTAETPAAISSLGTKTSGGDATVVEYAVSTAADQATGVYKDTITYTATTN